MVVCLCTGSSEGDIERALDAGARTLSEIGDSCRAGLDCGGCHPTLQEILHRRSCEGCPERKRLEFLPSDSATRVEFLLEGSGP